MDHCKISDIDAKILLEEVSKGLHHLSCARNPPPCIHQRPVCVLSIFFFQLATRVPGQGWRLKLPRDQAYLDHIQSDAEFDRWRRNSFARLEALSVVLSVTVANSCLLWAEDGETRAPSPPSYRACPFSPFSLTTASSKASTPTCSTKSNLDCRCLAK